MTVVVLQVMSDEYSHRPSESGGINTRPLSDQDDADLMTMPQLRIGLHVGPFVAGYVDMGGTPKFDLLRLDHASGQPHAAHVPS